MKQEKFTAEEGQEISDRTSHSTGTSAKNRRKWKRYP